MKIFDNHYSWNPWSKDNCPAIKQLDILSCILYLVTFDSRLFANCIKLLVWSKTCYVFFFFLSSFNWLTIYYHVLLQLINHILSRLRLSTICPLIRTKTIFKLGIIKLIFCCTDNRESYFESVGRGNSKNLTFQNREIVDSGF